MRLPDVSTWGPAHWSAAAAWLTALVALSAAVVAFRQYRVARRAREEQAQAALDSARLTRDLAEEQARPYVVAYLEPSGIGDAGLVDLVVRNFGKTAARDVTMTCDPELRRSTSNEDDPTEPVVIFDRLGLLAPGQEWRTYWDRTWVRHGRPDLANRHEVVLRYRDPRSQSLEEWLSLEWAPLINRDTLTVYGTHHIADALRRIEKTLGRFKESASGGVRVWTRDGDARDARERERREALREESGSVE